MQPADPDRLVGEAEGGVRRAEPLARIARALPAEVHEAIEGDAHLRHIWAEEVPHRAGLKVFAPRRDRRVSGEDDARAGDEPRLFEGHLTRSPELPDPLDCAEEAVSLVEMKHARVETERAQDTNAADAEHDLLAQATVRFGHVEAVGGGCHGGGGGTGECVEQAERATGD